MSRIILVRHGQASWGEKDYDNLSDLGHEQARVVGRELAERGVEPSRVVSGSMRRQCDTAGGLVEAAGWPLEPVTDSAWDEYAHTQILTAYKPAYRSMALMKADLARTLRPYRAFDEMYAVATERWVAGEHAGDYDEPFLAFGERVLAGLHSVVENLGRGETAVVVSSAGAISWAVAALLGGGGATWTQLQRVIANASLTSLAVGASGASLRTFNDTTHLERVPDLLTTR
ncbi:phosphoglycerate mutase [Knoellia sinensis KCTC 19936]|uniref:Phosphoglycerate mutase n=1 Tax=Knoellia sinensis KCTC 19936 TaxID=1385520 RepID=A0A0A0JAE5_9MICO|nr:histidine phosphatase family protein [Knoellia sinensis]KGN34108.1 phosphoglycerate mutase [Knoellia sinensis KCTC 19936]